ncbi:Phenylacetaldehyde dehydrogenase [Cedecea neteri]|uniref:Phenylacetaldehyde dehydrogenase n=1 Tax=Cedecea neteri TaxID=158822 RepID=A0A2X3IMU9_9ENTR|nr:Phenylacetaldehyde dehydrogenase [Cedecea neteri]
MSGFEQAVKSLQVGAGMDPAAHINPLVSKVQQQKVAGYLAQAQEQHAEIISGNSGPQGSGYYIAPTLVVNPSASLRLAKEEVFGRWSTLCGWRMRKKHCGRLTTVIMA